MPYDDTKIDQWRQMMIESGYDEKAVNAVIMMEKMKKQKEDEELGVWTDRLDQGMRLDQLPEEIQGEGFDYKSKKEPLGMPTTEPTSPIDEPTQYMPETPAEKFKAKWQIGAGQEPSPLGYGEQEQEPTSKMPITVEELIGSPTWNLTKAEVKALDEIMLEMQLWESGGIPNTPQGWDGLKDITKEALMEAGYSRPGKESDKEMIEYYYQVAVDNWNEKNPVGVVPEKYKKAVLNMIEENQGQEKPGGSGFLGGIWDDITSGIKDRISGFSFK